MNIAFFHVGDNSQLPELFCQSARNAFPEPQTKIIHISDQKTKQVAGSSDILRVQGINKTQIMISRMIGYRNLLDELKEPVAFFDTDMLIIKRFNLDLSQGPLLCERYFHKNEIIPDDSPIQWGNNIHTFPEYKGQLMNDVFPYIGCFYADSNPDFLNEAIRQYKILDEKYHFWFGDQVAIREAAKLMKINSVSEMQIACLPEFYNEQKYVLALHFKGKKRKRMIDKYFQKITSTSDNQNPRSSYRSNPSKPGFEIEQTFNAYFARDLIGSNSAELEFFTANDIDLGARADLICKIIYLLSLENILPENFGLEVYKKHILGLNHGHGKDSFEKNGVDDYISSFSKLFDTIKSKGFDKSISVVPINYDGVLVDGSHRTSIAIVLNLKLPVKQVPSKHLPTQSISALKNRFGLSEIEYFHSLNVYLRYQKCVKIFVLYPGRDYTADKTVIALIEKYFRIDAHVNYEINNFRDSLLLVSSLYSGSDWISNQKDAIGNLKWKAKAIRGDKNKAALLICTPKYFKKGISINAVKDLKELARTFYKKGFHSIHSTDNCEENVLLFENLFINKIKDTTCGYNFSIREELLSEKQKEFLNYLASLDLNIRHQVIVSGGLVLACLGIRNSKDIDLVTDLKFKHISEVHNQFIEKYSSIHSYREVLFEEGKSFCMLFRGKIIRLISLSLLLEIKEKRFREKPNEKDRNDIDLINEYLRKVTILSS